MSRKHSQATIEKIRKSQLGRVFSAETRLKMRNSHLGIKLSPKHRAKVIKTLRPIRKGGTYEEAFGSEIASAMKAKMRQAKLGKKMPWNKGEHCKGEKNWQWKGGTSKNYRTGYYSTKYKQWRKQVFERDGYTCQDCGVKGTYLTAHHIKSFAHYPTLRFELSNGLTLCEDCHKLTDNYKGRNRGKTRDDLTE